jgi:magnesium transporter
LQNLLFTKPGDRAENVVKKIRTIKHTAPSERVIERFLENPHQKIVVLGENNAVMGVLYSDDVIRILQEREISSLYDFAGLSEEETVEDSIKFKVKRRYKWLIINLFTGFIVAFTVNLFDETISKYVLLAVYMPIVAGMGGNAATQTLAILVRGITLNQISLETAMPTLLKEVGAGLINGVINGVIVFAIVYLFNRDPYVGLVLAAAMIINLLVAGFFGTLVPLLMKRLGKDPATSATIFITTATDVLGFLAFLGLATLVLK